MRSSHIATVRLVSLLAGVAVAATIVLVALVAVHFDSRTQSPTPTTTITSSSMRLVVGVGARGGAMCTTDADCAATVVVVPEGSVPRPVWRELLRLGYHGQPGDGMEAIYAPRTVVDQVMVAHGYHA